MSANADEITVLFKSFIGCHKANFVLCGTRGAALTEKWCWIAKCVVAPLLRREEWAMDAIGEAESRELIRLFEFYGKAYCEQIEHLSDT